MPEQNKPDNLTSLPSVTLPKGGGAIQGMGEKFEVNAITGTASFSLTVPISPARHGFSPMLSLVYNSGSGNGIMGFGWNITLASIVRKTSKGLPRYEDDDVFLLSDAEDLVPVMQEVDGKWEPIIYSEEEYQVMQYRPRTEGLFAKIEKLTDVNTGFIYWRVTTKENIKHIYGGSVQSTIHAPADKRQIFQWLIEKSYDAKGNIIVYEYQQENDQNIDTTKPSERNRLANPSSFSNTYLKYIRYGNTTRDGESDFHFHIAIDYGDHNLTAPAVLPDLEWPARKDPFSSFRSGFDIRTYRLCRRILLFHHFPEKGLDFSLTKSMTLEYDETPACSLLTSVTYTGHKKNEKGIQSKSMPPVVFTYSSSTLNTETKELEEGALSDLFNGADLAQYQWLDYNSEGLPGLLVQQNNAWMFKANAGNGDFDAGKLIASKPLITSLENKAPVFSDIDGDGNFELLLRNEQMHGYYKQQMGTWENFRTFNNNPQINYNDPNLRFIDIDGDGLADILITEDELFCVFLSKGKEGYAPPAYTRMAQDEETGPKIAFSNDREAIYLADMTGDGLSDIVRIRNGSICYWPNAGYGKFGNKVEMGNAPFFEAQGQFDPSRIHIGDIDGTGTTDILYILHDNIVYCINESGNSFNSPQKITNLPFTDDHSSVLLIDLLGNGTSCLVWSSAISGTEKMKFCYIDLLGSTKPYLLFGINNNMGRETLVEYGVSTEFYLDDKKNNTPWITPLPFPVFVIKKTTIIDHISSCSLVTSYKYHHGYYDGEEREFRGFGMVEQTDAESFDTYSDDATTDQPPVYTKTWFHTGVYKNSKNFSLQYKSEYFNSDTEAYDMPDSVVENDAEMDYRSLREACRTFRGRMLRQEIYSNDGTAKQGIPYQVTESNYAVRQIQPVIEDHFAVYLTSSRESITYNYERNAEDPRITHAFVLETDQYGFSAKAVSIAYPRRSGGASVYSEQQKLSATATTSEYIHNISLFYLLGVPQQTRSFEINGLLPATDGYLSFDLIRDSLADVFNDDKVLQHQQEFNTGAQARLNGWTQYYYSDNNLELPFGSISAQALLFRTKQIAMSDAYLPQVYGTKVNASMMEEAGYQLSDGYWWKYSPQLRYLDATGFYLSLAVIDPFWNESTIAFDEYFLIVVRQTDAIGNTITAVPDYKSLTYSSVTDINENSTEILSDPMGMVIATTSYGMVNGELKGDSAIIDYVEKEIIDIETILSNPKVYLQGATQFFYYDLQSWKERNETPYFISLQRETRVSELAPSEETAIQVLIGFSDGFGRELQTKLRVDDGPLTEDSEAILERWLVSGRKVYNNKQKTIKQYEPFYSGTHLYEDEETVAPVGVTPVVYYDPLDRAIKTDSPKGFYSMVEFDPWQVSHYDENDTVKDSIYYLLHSAETGAEADALRKAEGHYNTPNITVLDTLYRVFRNIQYTVAGGPELITTSTFDIQGNILTITDPRQSEANASRSEGGQVHNFIYSYDLQKNKLCTVSTDGGEAWVLNNVLGKPVHTWNARGYHSSTEYDSLQRPAKSTIDGNGLNNIVHLLVYGETVSDAADKNLNGQLYHQYDEAGMVENSLFDLTGALISSTRTLRKEYKAEVNWVDIGAEVLETETFALTNSYDALGRVVQFIKPDGSITTNYYHQAGWLKAVDVQLKNEATATTFISAIEYNAKGQRTQIIYGNGIQTKYSYEKETFRLDTLKTTRQESDGSITALQDIAYVYDPVGNIVQITDHSFEKVFASNQEVEPVCDYTYDALYQLVKATGREHKALTATNYQLNGAKYKEDHFANLNDAAQLANYIESYTYDTAGNLEEIKHTGFQSYTRVMTVAENSNRSITDEMDRTVDIDSYFDVAGNMIQLEHLRQINWNYRNNIASVTIIERDSENDAEYYVYESAGSRLRKVKETFDRAGSLLRKEEKIYVGGLEIKRTSRGNSETLAEERYSNHIMDKSFCLAIVYYFTITDSSSTPAGTNIIRYQFNNHLGSASMETDESGALISYEEYLPYGGTAFTTGTSEVEVAMKEYRYAGKERDDTTGLYYYGARYYASWIGRWLSCDPISIQGGINLYRIANNNPLIFTDGFGKVPLTCSESELSAEAQSILIQNKVPFSTETTVAYPSPGGRTRADLLIQNGPYWKPTSIIPSFDYDELKSETGSFTKNQLARGIDTEPKGVSMELRTDRAQNMGVSKGQLIEADVYVTRPSNLDAFKDRVVGKGIVRDATRPAVVDIALSGFEFDEPDEAPRPTGRLSMTASITPDADPSPSALPSVSLTTMAKVGGTTAAAARVAVPGFVEAEIVIEGSGMLALSQGASSIPVIGEVSYAAATAPTAVTSVAAASGVAGLVTGYATGRIVEPPVTRITGSKTAGTVAATVAGAGTGAVAGAAVGAAVGVWGFGIAAVPAAAVGAVVGGVAGGIGGYLASYW